MSLKGVLKLPFTLTLDSLGVTKTANTADVESEIIDYQVPKSMAVAFRPGDTLYLFLSTAVPAQITDGTLKVKIADANKVVKLELVIADLASLDAGGTPEDRTKQYVLKAGFSRAEDQHVIFSLV